MDPASTTEHLQIAIFRPGTLVVDRYRLIERLTSGWSGVGWVAYDIKKGNQVVVNVLPQIFAANVRGLETLRRVGERCNANAPAAFVRFQDWFAVDNSAFYVTELVRGPSFSQLRLRHDEGIFEPRDLGDLGVELCEALQQLHAHDLAHGDLHPGHLLKDLRNRLRITGFGIAQILADVRFSDADRLAMGRSCKSPQQLAGKAATPADDVYAVGAIFFHLLTSQLITSPTSRGIGSKAGIAPVAAVREYFGIQGKVIGSGWDALIQQCLSAEADERPSPAEMAAVLRQMLVKSEPVAAALKSRSSRGGTQRENPPGDSLRGPTTPEAGGGMVSYGRKTRPRSQKMMLFYGASLVSLTCVCTLAWMHSTREMRKREGGVPAAPQVTGAEQAALSPISKPDNGPSTGSKVNRPQVAHTDAEKKLTKVRKEPTTPTPKPAGEVETPNGVTDIGQTKNTDPISNVGPVGTPSLVFHTDKGTEIAPALGTNEVPDGGGRPVGRAERGEHPGGFIQPSYPAKPAPMNALNDSELASVGKRVWQNECGGKVEGLTSWNKGENFASLGIGHFIWYPRGVRGPFQESFPHLVEFLQANGTALPGWMLQEKDCPWSNREEFIAAIKSPKMGELRAMLVETVPLQSRFLAERLRSTVLTLGDGLDIQHKEHVLTQYGLLSRSSRGTFALIDYVNFKGEGTNPKERYAGEGWGLLQVLQEMKARVPEEAPGKFGEAAERVLRRRVKNSPQAQVEAQWIPGWASRVHAY